MQGPFAVLNSLPVGIPSPSRSLPGVEGSLSESAGKHDCDSNVAESPSWSLSARISTLVAAAADRLPSESVAVSLIRYVPGAQPEDPEGVSSTFSPVLVPVKSGLG
jgi:hypothetical protein